jgi:hypothetical protein
MAHNTTSPNDYTSRLNGDLRKTGAAVGYACPTEQAGP